METPTKPGKGKNPASLANLKANQSKAAEIGKLGGRPKGSKSFKDILNKALDQKYDIPGGNPAYEGLTKREVLMLELMRLAFAPGDFAIKPGDRMKAVEMIKETVQPKIDISRLLQ